MKKIYKSKIGLELVIPIVLILGTVLILTISENPVTRIEPILNEFIPDDSDNS